ncbi:helix-turn-helix domain-containing protein [Allobranchiibius sp. CTAmp26]|nr:helix-turn-helix domain-containing protein [Allobranchiibius sp. CTAmp26]
MLHQVTDRLTETAIEELVQSYVAGTAATELGPRYGISRNTVLALVRSRGGTVRQVAMTADEVSTAQRLYNDGASLREIGTRLGRNPDTISRQLRRRGYSIRARRRAARAWSPPRRDGCPCCRRGCAGHHRMRTRLRRHRPNGPDHRRDRHIDAREKGGPCPTWCGCEQSALAFVGLLLR